MELMLRCALPDRPGALARLAGTVAAAGGDIQAVDVVESAGGVALDDLVVVIDADRVQVLLDGIAALEGVEAVHHGPSRGHPGDAVTRLAVGVEALLSGAAPIDDGLTALLGGLLRASAAQWQPSAAAPPQGRRVLVLQAGDGRALVLRRDYRFTDTERERAQAVWRTGLAAAMVAAVE